MPQTDPRRKRATRNADHARRTHVPAPADADIEARLDELVRPAIYAEMAYYRTLGRRNRILTLPVMVALVLVMLWRRVPSVRTLGRMLERERLLWNAPCRVSQASLSERFLTFPAELFERILDRVLAELPQRGAARTRPAPRGLDGVCREFAGVYAFDGTTLEALFRKVQALRDDPTAPLAGHVLAVVNLATRLPAKLWYAQDPSTHDTHWLPDLLEWLPPNSLSVFDRGFSGFAFFDALTQAGQGFVTRMKDRTSFTVTRVLLDEPHLKDRIVRLGIYPSNGQCAHPLRLIEVRIQGKWRRYLTNVLEPDRLNAAEVVQWYAFRWRIETAFLSVKRLLDLSYLWVGSANGVQLQVWGTWLFYAILMDLCDDVADVLGVELERVSVEMVYRGLYFYVLARSQGYEGSAAEYLAREARGLGILKQTRKTPSALDALRLLFPAATVAQLYSSDP